MFKRYKDRWFDILLLLCLLSAMLYVHGQSPEQIQRLRYLAFDEYNKLFPRVTPYPDLYPQHEIAGVVIIDIDETSLQKYGQWPWGRDKVALMVENLNKLGAKTIAFDMVFAEEDRTSSSRTLSDIPAEERLAIEKKYNIKDSDDVLAKAIKKAGNVVTAFVGSDQKTLQRPIVKARFFNSSHKNKKDENEVYKSNPREFVFQQDYFATNLRILSKSSAGNGFFTASPEQDGIIRYVPLLLGQKNEDTGKVDLYPSLALEAIRVAIKDYAIETTSFINPVPEGYGITAVHLGATPYFRRNKGTGKKEKIYGRYDIPTDKRGRIPVYYSGHKQSRYIPAWKILDNEVSTERIKNKIILIGTSSIGLLDLRSSPLDSVLPGVEIHAEIIEQILSGKYLQRPQFFDVLEKVIMASVGSVIILLLPFVSTLFLVALTSLLLGGILFASIYYYITAGFLLDPVYSGIVTMLLFTFAAVLTSFRQENQKKFYRSAFGHYISEDLMNELLASPDKLTLGGVNRELSVMFTDVRNFTTISETVTPEQLIKMMNDFLTPMTSAIMDSKGTIDKYMGDAIMAFWNAPVEVEDHPRKACKVALLMSDLLIPVNKKLEEEAKEEGRVFHQIRAGIGIVTGACSVGNMGSKQRFAYSALGDTVNLASRLEGQTKVYGVETLVGHATYNAVPDYAFLELDLLMVKGRQEPERIYTIIGDEIYADTAEFKAWKQSHDEMLELYRAKKFKQAKSTIIKLKKLSIKEYHFFYDLYLERIVEYQNNPPAKNWSGVWIATSK